MLSSSFTRWTALAGVAVVLVLGTALLSCYHFLPEGLGQRGNAADQPGFREVAEESGITFRMEFLPGEQGENFKTNLYDHGCGVAVGDYDGDGHEDIYFCNQLGPNALYRNRGDGTFEDVTRKAGVGLGDRICVGATWADYDNDGRLDLFVTSTRGGNVLFRNTGNGTFQDVTQQAGVGYKGHSQTAAFFDYDNDGFLDLLVLNTARWTLDERDQSGLYYRGVSGIWSLASAPIEHNILYRNLGNGKFEDVTEKVGLKGKGWGGDAVVFDYNEDGWLDVLITNMFGASQLYRNNAGKNFTDVTREVLGRISFGAIGAKAFDFNNDGKFDLFITDMHSDMWLPPPFPPDPRKFPPDTFSKKYSHIMGYAYERGQASTIQAEKQVADSLKLRYQDVVFGNTLFKRLPSGKFEEMSDRAGLETWWPWGIATGDFDNDGYEDLFIASGMGFPYAYWPNALMMNNGNETFSDRAVEHGIEPPPGGKFLPDEIGGQPAARSSRAVAVADFTGTGRLDLVVNNFNDRAYFFRNHFPPQNWIAFRLTGGMRQRDAAGTGKSNRDAVGAVVRLYVGKEVMVRQVQAAGGYLSHSSRTLHFGLGKRDRVDRIEVRWPSGRRSTIRNPAPNTTHPLVEGQSPARTE